MTCFFLFYFSFEGGFTVPLVSMLHISHPTLRMYRGAGELRASSGAAALLISPPHFISSQD